MNLWVAIPQVRHALLRYLPQVSAPAGKPEPSLVNDFQWTVWRLDPIPGTHLSHCKHLKLPRW